MSTAAPKYLLAERVILEAVRQGRFPPGSRLPGDRELAKSLKVAPLTLGHAMRRLCERGILDRRPRVGTFVRASSVAPNIAVLVFNDDRIETGISCEALERLNAEALPRGHQVRATLLTRPYPPLAQLREELRAMRVGALGLLDFLNTDRDYIAALSKLMPCVLFNKGLSGLNLSCATPDMFAGARMIADFLARRGRKSVAAGLFNVHHQRHVELSIALEAECRSRGIAVDRGTWSEGYSFAPERGAEWLARLGSLRPGPDALVVVSGARTEELRTWFETRRARLGRELDVVALRPVGAARRDPVPWPVLAYDDGEAMLTATRMLCDVIEGAQSPSETKVARIAPELILPGDLAPGAA
jgi:DNA-binding LacI/PurR family transcriptional regulator